MGAPGSPAPLTCPPETGTRMNARNWANGLAPILVPVFGEQTIGRPALRLKQRDDYPLCLPIADQGAVATLVGNRACPN